MTRLRVADLSYPAIFFVRGDFRIWKDSRSAFCEDAGVLVDANARCYKMIRDERLIHDGRRLTRPELRQRIESQRTTVVYEGEPFSTSLDELRTKIVFMVSARGHFESPHGFGLPPDLEHARTVSELLEIVARAQNVPRLGGL